MLMFTSAVYGTEVTTSAAAIDKTLFKKISAGDKAAFAELYDAARAAVFSYALSVLRSESDAEDAAQETFLKIRSAAHLYKSYGKPMSWILTITKNICRMRLRSMQHYSSTPFEEYEGTSTLDRIADAEDRMVLKTAFRILDKTECRIILLHAVSGLKHREIAGLLEMPVATVLSKYSRGLKKLRKELEGQL